VEPKGTRIDKAFESRKLVNILGIEKKTLRGGNIRLGAKKSFSIEKRTKREERGKSPKEEAQHIKVEGEMRAEPHRGKTSAGEPVRLKHSQLVVLIGGMQSERN